jgi:hypothetical protein
MEGARPEFPLPGEVGNGFAPGAVVNQRAKGFRLVVIQPPLGPGAEVSPIPPQYEHQEDFSIQAWGLA